MSVFGSKKMKNLCGGLALAAASLLSFAVSPSPAAEAQPDIAVSPAVAPKDTARYLMMVSTMSSMGMSGQRMMMLDARGLPAAGTPQQAWHMIPEGLKMGKYLPLVRPEKPTGEAGEPGKPVKQEEWTTKIYWSCAKEVPGGQPMVISSKDGKKNGQLFDAYSGSALAFWKQPAEGWGWGQWPNKEYMVQVPADGSLKGEHLVHGNYLPHVKFDVSQHDFLGALEVETGDGNLDAFIPVTWKSLPGAIGYFVYATAANAEKKEAVIWTSSQKATYGIQSYEHSGRIKELQGAGVVLKSDVQACNIPAGIFAGYQNPIIMVYAWGNDYWASYPQKPANPPKGWKPDWTVSGLFLSQWSGMPGGMPQGGGAGAQGTDGQQAPEKKNAKPKIGVPKLF